MNFCNTGGYLVGADDWLPVEPTDYFRASYAIGVVGCNTVACSGCNQRVRHALGYTAVPQLDPATVFAAPQWADLKGAEPKGEKNGRLYSCACKMYVAFGARHLDTSSDGDPDLTPPWRCAGHPSFIPPGVIGGVKVELSRGWSPIVAAQLEATSNVHPTTDRIPGFVLTRIFQALQSQEEKHALGLAVGSRGDDTSLRARQAVALFFALNGNAQGLEQVLDAWRADPSRYDEQPAAAGRERSIKSNLLDAIAFRISSNSRGAEHLLATWRWAALRGSGLGAHLHRAPLIDAAWTKEHVERLLDLAPADWEDIILSIRVEFPMRLVPGCRRAIREGHATRERVVATLLENYGAKAEPAIAAL